MPRHLMSINPKSANLGEQVSIVVWSQAEYAGRTVLRIADKRTPRKKTILGWSRLQSTEYIWETSHYQPGKHIITVEFIYPLGTLRPSVTLRREYSLAEEDYVDKERDTP